MKVYFKHFLSKKKRKYVRRNKEYLYIIKHLQNMGKNYHDQSHKSTFWLSLIYKWRLEYKEYKFQLVKERNIIYKRKIQTNKPKKKSNLKIRSPHIGL